MSTKLHDFPQTALIGNCLTPTSETSTVTTAGVDMVDGDGNCTGVQSVQAVQGTNPTLAGAFQESDDNSTGWTAVNVNNTDAKPATTSLAQVTTVNSFQSISFQRTKRYVRYVGTIGGTATPTFVIAAFCFEQRKFVTGQ